jgi:hypothetical protein
MFNGIADILEENDISAQISWICQEDAGLAM